jgi:hypothetical protein
MQDVQTARSNAAIDRARTQPEVEELRSCYDAMLELRECRDRRVDSTP